MIFDAICFYQFHVYNFRVVFFIEANGHAPEPRRWRYELYHDFYLSAWWDYGIRYRAFIIFLIVGSEACADDDKLRVTDVISPSLLFDLL